MNFPFLFALLGHPHDHWLCVDPVSRPGRMGILWGLGTLFFPLIELFFIALHWKRSRRGFPMQSPWLRVGGHGPAFANGVSKISCCYEITGFGLSGLIPSSLMA